MTPPPALPEGFQHAVAVVVGQPDAAPAAGLVVRGYRRLPDRQDGARRSPAPRSRRAADALPLPNHGRHQHPAPRQLDAHRPGSVVDPVNRHVQPAFGTPSLVMFAALNPSTASTTSATTR